MYARTRLFKVLDKARKSPVVWIAGPPGAGKTTLVASYLRQRTLPMLWYQVDESDADASTFFYYLGVAAKLAAPRRRSSLPLLTPEYTLSLATFARNFFAHLFQRMKASSVLVLDNYQEAPEDCALHEMLRCGLENIAEKINIVIISRAPPPPALARLEMHGHLTSIDWNSLRLDENETRQIIRQSGKRLAGPDELHELVDKTQGWIAGLVLMLEHLRSRETLPEASIERTPQVVFNYFAGEVLDRAAPELRDLLVKASLLPQVSARMAEALTGTDGAAAILAQLERRNYFILRLSASEPTYQFHPLFREFLLTRLDEYPQAERVALCRRAAGLAESAGQVETALELWRKAEAVSDLARCVLAAAKNMYMQGRWRTLADWIEELPPAARETEPWLLYWHAQCQGLVNPRGARALFEAALTGFRDRGDRIGALLSWVGIVEFGLHEGRNLDRLDHWIGAFRDIAGDEPLPREIEERVSVSMLIALVMAGAWHGDFELWRVRAAAVLGSGTDPYSRVVAGTYLCIYDSWMGDPARAGQSLAALDNLIKEIEQFPLLLILVRTTEAMHAALVTAEDQRCVEIVEQAIAHGERVGVRFWEHHLLCHGASAALYGDNLKAAQRLLAMLKDRLNTARPIDVAFYHYLSNDYALRRGDLVAAQAEASACAALDETVGLHFGRALVAMMEARTRIALGKLDDVRVFIDRLHEIAAAERSALLSLQAQITDAELALRTGNDALLRECLARVFTNAREHNLVTCHGWRQDLMAELCARALESGIEVAYVQQLIRRRRLSPPEPRTHQETWPWAVKIFTLGRFQLFRDSTEVPVKGAAKPLGLLRALIAFGGRSVPQERLTDALWPDAEGDSGRRAFDTTLHRLRRLLGHDAALAMNEGRLTLDARLCWVDFWALEHELSAAESALNQAASSTADPRETLDRIAHLYRGPFLQDDGDTVWALTQRERLHTRVLSVLRNLGRQWETGGQIAQAIVCYEKGLAIDPLLEHFYQRLMHLHAKAGHRAEALSVYTRCAKTLAALLHVSPSPETVAAYEALRGH